MTRAGLGQTVWTPSMVNNYLREVDSLIDQVHRDYKRAYEAGEIDKDLYRGWARFRLNWLQFRADNIITGQWFGSTVDQAERYRREVRGWREKLMESGADVTAAEIPDEPPTPAEKAVSDLTWIFGVGAVLVFGIWVLR